MRQTRVVWHGRTEELTRLVESAVAHCTCQAGVTRRCAAHQILGDQNTLDRLAFARSVRSRLVAEEWHVSSALCWPLELSRPMLISLLALLLMLAMPLPEHAQSLPGQSLASWQTR